MPPEFVVRRVLNSNSAEKSCGFSVVVTRKGLRSLEMAYIQERITSASKPMAIQFIGRPK